MEHSNTLDRVASWVIVNIATGQPVFETFIASVAGKINMNKYKAVPIGKWLASLSHASQSAQNY